MSEETKSTANPKWTHCVFKGPPPYGHANWGSWLQSEPLEGVFVRRVEASDWTVETAAASPAAEVTPDLLSQHRQSQAAIMVLSDAFHPNARGTWYSPRAVAQLLRGEKTFCSYPVGQLHLAYPPIDAPSAAAVQAEPAELMARFCPGCGSVGDVEVTYRNCCPDGGRARVIPESLARHCHDLFALALDGATSNMDADALAMALCKSLPHIFINLDNRDAIANVLRDAMKDWHGNHPVDRDRSAGGLDRRQPAGSDGRDLEAPPVAASQPQAAEAVPFDGERFYVNRRA